MFWILATTVVRAKPHKLSIEETQASPSCFHFFTEGWLIFLWPQKKQKARSRVHLTCMHLPCLIQWYSLGLTLINQLLTPQTLVLMSPVVWLISLYTGLCNGKMPKGHVSFNSSTPPPLVQCANTHLFLLLRQITSSHFCTYFLILLGPDFLLGALVVHTQSTTACVSAFTKCLQRLAITSGNVLSRVTAYQADPFHTEGSITNPVW